MCKGPLYVSGSRMLRRIVEGVVLLAVAVERRSSERSETEFVRAKYRMSSMVSGEMPKSAEKSIVDLSSLAAKW